MATDQTAEGRDALYPIRPIKKGKVGCGDLTLGHPIANGVEFKLEMLDPTPFDLEQTDE